MTRQLESSTAIVLSGTFTLDSLAAPLELLLQETAALWPVRLAPYRQMFQELLDPTSESARNKKGMNVLLVRIEDWLPQPESASTGTAPTARSTPAEIVDDFLRLLEERSGSWPAGASVAVCPSLRGDAAPWEARLREGLARIAQSRVRVIPLPSLARLDEDEIYDREGDRLANIPYTPLAFSAMARDLARASHAVLTPRPKVIVLDCDNTLWDGVVGEDGVDGVRVSDQRRAFHELLRSKRRAGLLLCLASKNMEEDVLEVFRRRNDLGLHLDDLVGWKINWQPKAINVRELATELNLGLDSFVFLDDNPVEIAEMQAACPQVLSLQIPSEPDLMPFLEEIWPLDAQESTEEDRRRTELYRENLARDRFQKASSHLSDFLQGLGLTVDIHPPRPDQVARAAQLTQRTNQFNFTTVRRTEAQLASALGEGLQCRVVEVSDRFGDYGLVGVLLFTIGGESLEIDTFLLSCRVLGRGVEHTMIRHLGEAAKEANARYVEALFVPSAKNAPAARFLSSWPPLPPLPPRLPLLPGSPEEPGLKQDAVQRFVLTDEAARAFSYHPPDGETPEEETPGSQELTPVDASPQGAPFALMEESRSEVWNRFAREHRTPQITCERLRGPRTRPLEAPIVVQPHNAREELLQRIWRDVLCVEVGVEDDFFSLGGTSLLAVTVFARIEREMGLRLPLALLVECPTIVSLAARLEGPRELASLVPLHQADDDFADGVNESTPLFLVHDADGETLLYRNLARRLGRHRSVYGLQPRANAGAAIVHTRIEDMAKHYIAEMRKVRSHGPYLLGGLCAGGVVAYEMTRQLEKMGETVRLVALFDAADVEAVPRRYMEGRKRLARLKAAVRAAPLRHLPRVLASKAMGFSSYRLASRIRLTRDRLAVSTLRVCFDYGLPIPAWARGVSVRAVYTAAEAVYKPRHRVREDILLFRATSGEGPEEPSIQRYADPNLGWTPRTAKNVRVFDVPGGHGSMLQEPHVEVLAAHLTAYLDALAREPADSLASLSTQADKTVPKAKTQTWT